MERTGILFVTLFLTSVVGQMNFIVEVLDGTSTSSCDFGFNDEALWGVKAFTQTEYTVFNGDGYSRCEEGPSPNNPVVVLNEDVECLEQPDSMEVCLMAGDDNGNSCSFEDFECFVEECRTVPIRTCFLQNCFVDFFVEFDVSNNNVNTQDVSIRITRSGDCSTPFPTEAPSNTPTLAPVRPTVRPTKAPTGKITLRPTLPCAGTLETCDGGPGYFGPSCCISGHICEENICRIVQTEAASTNEIDGGALAASLTFFGFVLIAWAVFHYSVKSKAKKDAEVEDGETPPLGSDNFKHYTDSGHQISQQESPKAVVNLGDDWEELSSP